MRCCMRSFVTAVLVVPALAGGLAAQLVLPSEGQPCFDGSAWSVDNAAASAAVDLNADGYPDMVLAGAVTRSLLNNGHGLFVLAHTTGPVPPAQRIVAGDLDGDGFTDLATSHFDTVLQAPAGISTLLGDGEGRLVFAGTQAAEWVRGLSLGDFDQDGTLDVVASHGGDGVSLQLLRGQGDGSFAPPVWTAGITSNSVDTGDWDQDGDPDVLVSSPSDVSILLGDGTGSFAAGPSAGWSWGSEGKLVDVDQQDGLDVLTLAQGFPDAVVLITQTPLGGLADPITFPVEAAEQLAVISIPGPGSSSGVTVAASGDFITRFDVTDGTLLAEPAIDFPDASSSLSLADFDGDGDADVLASRPTGDAWMLFADGAALQTPSHLPLIGTAVNVANFAARDVSGDGDPDLVTVDTTNAKLHVALGGPGGNFGAWHGQATSAQPIELELVDATSDGELDALTLARFAPALGVHPGDGAGQFGAQVLTPISSTVLTAGVGDLDDDGQPDAVVLRDTGSLNVLQAYEGVGDGSFVPAGTASLIVGTMTSTEVTLGDFDANGQLDVATALAGGGLAAGAVFISKGDGNGGLGGATLAFPLSVALSLELKGSVVTGDFDADGLADLGVSCNLGGSVAILTGKPTGGFDAPVRGGLEGVPARGLLAADVDEDGKLDLAHATNLEAMVAVMRGDGAGGFISTSAHPGTSTSGNRVLAAADFDQDGLSDLLQLGTVAKDIALLRRLGTADNAWASIGGGIPGASGQPRLLGSGDPIPAGSVTLDVDFAAPGAATWLVAGLALLDAPFKGGHLVPQPQLILPTGAADADGSLQLAFGWPAGIPSGTELWLQSFIADGSASHGFGATGGLRLTVP